MQVFSTRVLQILARPLQTALLKSGIVDAAINWYKLADFFHDLRRVRIFHWIIHLLGKPGNNLPIRLAVSNWRDSLANTLNTPFSVGKGTVFFGKACAGQDYVSI